MQTLDYNPDLTSATIPSKRLPPLDTVVILPSRYLYAMQAALYLSFFASVVGVFLPRLDQEMWWLIPMLVIGVLVLRSWRSHRQSACLTRRIWFGHKGWFLETGGITEPVTLSGETLVWPWVVILRFKPYRIGSDYQQVVVMRDSVSEKDFRQLSCWLRVCLKPRR